MSRRDPKHLSRVVALGCVVCNNLGHEGTPCQAHHVRHGQGLAQRADDREAIGLCHHHHQGKEGIHRLGTRAWEAKYGTEEALLAQVLDELGMGGGA